MSLIADPLLADPVALVETLLPGIADQRLPTPVAIEHLADDPTLIPLAVGPDPSGRPADGLLYWAQVSPDHLGEWQLSFSLDAAVRSGAVGRRFTTGLDVLDQPAPDALAPTGLVFHMSRCGSTLVSRALSRSPRHLVHSQPGVLRRGIWEVATRGWTGPPDPAGTDLVRFRNLLSYLLRPGGPGPRPEAAFIKLYSENVLFLDFVRAAFPHTPALFLFRDPGEVLASVADNGTGMLTARGTARAGLTSGLDPDQEADATDLEFLVACFARYFEVVLAHDRPGLTVLEYPDLRAEHFESIVLDAFGYRLPTEDLGAILDQFSYHAKSPSGAPTPYRDDSAAKRAAIDPADRALVEERLGPLLGRLQERAWRPDRSGA